MRENLSKIKERTFAYLRTLRFGAAPVHFVLIGALLTSNFQPALGPMSALISPESNLQPLVRVAEGGSSGKEVFGFAPYWNFDKLDGIDFNVLTTLAYFGVPVLSNGDLDRSDYGYETFKSKKATQLFQRAHQSGTKVVLTLTQMENWPILAILDDPQAQENAIEQAVEEVQKRGIDGINVDFEYDGNPGGEYRGKFTNFVAKLTEKMHKVNPNSKVTVSVYAASAKDPKLYDIGKLSGVSDGIFMMAYDFTSLGSDVAMPTAPLYGHDSGKYWYDVSTAVNDFLKVMPAAKLILGVPWYGVNFLVYEPEDQAQTRPSYSWRGRPVTQPYSVALDNISPSMDGVLDFKTGWDNSGQVGWKAYFVAATDTWRMLFLDDAKSLGIKYDFAKDKDLGGVGIWALGFDEGKKEMWHVLKEKFGNKLADSSVKNRRVYTEGDYEQI